MIACDCRTQTLSNSEEKKETAAVDISMEGPKAEGKSGEESGGFVFDRYSIFYCEQRDAAGEYEGLTPQRDEDQGVVPYISVVVARQICRALKIMT